MQTNQLVPDSECKKRVSPPAPPHVKKRTTNLENESNNLENYLIDFSGDRHSPSLTGRNPTTNSSPPPAPIHFSETDKKSGGLCDACKDQFIIIEYLCKQQLLLTHSVKL